MYIETSTGESIVSTQIARELVALTGQPGPGIRKLIEMAANSQLPMEKSGRFWVCRRSRLPALAQALGLPLKVAA
jgi:hypothetical protein